MVLLSPSMNRKSYCFQASPVEGENLQQTWNLGVNRSVSLMLKHIAFKFIVMTQFKVIS